MNDVERQLREDAADMTDQIKRLTQRRDAMLREADVVREARMRSAWLQSQAQAAGYRTT